MRHKLWTSITSKWQSRKVKIPYIASLSFLGARFFSYFFASVSHTKNFDLRLVLCASKSLALVNARQVRFLPEHPPTRLIPAPFFRFFSHFSKDFVTVSHKAKLKSVIETSHVTLSYLAITQGYLDSTLPPGHRDTFDHIYAKAFYCKGINCPMERRRRCQ